jgi:hypothetical protein
MVFEEAYGHQPEIEDILKPWEIFRIHFLNFRQDYDILADSTRYGRD